MIQFENFYSIAREYPERTWQWYYVESFPSTTGRGALESIPRSVRLRCFIVTVADWPDSTLCFLTDLYEASVAAALDHKA